MNTIDLIEQFTKELPPVFAATELDRLTGNAIRWRTIQNLRAQKRLPENRRPPERCFRKDGCRKIIIIRDEFLRWWVSGLQSA